LRQGRQILAAASVGTGQGLTKADDPLRDFRPKYVSDTSQLFHDLNSTNRMKSWGIDMAESASKALTTSFGHALPYLLLVVAVLVTGIVQQRQIAGRNSGAQVNPQQQMIMKLMPIFLPVFSFAMPAGLVIYFIVSNLWRVGQQAVITRKFYRGEHSLGNLAMAARTAVIEEPEPEPKAKANGSAKDGADSAAPKPTVGRNRSTMARPSNRVGGRLRELDTKPSDNKGPSKSNKDKSDKKGAGNSEASPKFTSGRATPKSGDGKGKRK